MTQKQHTSHTIAILGAGVVGLCMALVLRRDGHTVRLYDGGGFPATNASALAGGMVAPYAEADHMPHPWLSGAQAGIDFWHDIQTKDKKNIDFHHNGSVLIAHQADLHLLDRFANVLKNYDPNISTTLQDLRTHLPLLAKNFPRGLILQNEAHLSPALAMAALVELAQAAGVKLIAENTTLQAVKRDADNVIDCRGMGADDPQLRGVKGEIALVCNREFSLPCPVRLMHPRYPLYIVPRADHVFMIGATQIESSDSTHVGVRSVMELLSAVYSLHPSFAEAELISLQAGIRPAYPDNLPRITAHDGTIVCNGLFRHGWLLAPAIAQCVRDHLAGAHNPFISVIWRNA